jgi:hypothetical protein
LRHGGTGRREPFGPPDVQTVDQDGPEEAIIESENVYDLATVIYMVASAMMLNVCALAAVWADREPGNVATFEPVPAFGL